MVIDLVGLVVARLDADRGPLRQVGGAADMAAAEIGLKARPAAFAVLIAESPSAPPLAAEFIQRKQIVVSVVLAVSSARDQIGDAVREDLTAVRNHIEGVLLGWVPEGCAEGLAWAGARLQNLAPNNVLWWRDDFVTTQIVRLP